MSKPARPDPAKLVMSVMYSDEESSRAAVERAMERFGPVDYSTKALDFPGGRYYAAEMGEVVKRRLFAFKDPLDPAELPAVKLFANGIESEFEEAGQRRVNLDPGVMTVYNLVLATGKPAAHRPYLGDGVYADLTLVFESGSFQPLRWTYPDYASGEVIGWMNRVREAYKAAIRETKKKSGRVGPGEGD